MDELRSKYEKQLEEYNTLVEKTLTSSDLSQIQKLREMNTALSKTLNAMIEKATFLKKDTPNLTRERDELIERLRQIQKEYNGLLVNTDTLETLRRIRQQESSEANRQMYLYFYLFLIVCLGILLYVLFMSQRKDTTAPMASMPPTTAALV